MLTNPNLNTMNSLLNQHVNNQS